MNSYLQLCAMETCILPKEHVADKNLYVIALELELHFIHTLHIVSTYISISPFLYVKIFRMPFHTHENKSHKFAWNECVYVAFCSFLAIWWRWCGMNVIIYINLLLIYASRTINLTYSRMMFNVKAKSPKFTTCSTRLRMYKVN